MQKQTKSDSTSQGQQNPGTLLDTFPSLQLTAMARNTLTLTGDCPLTSKHLSPLNMTHNLPSTSLPSRAPCSTETLMSDTGSSTSSPQEIPGLPDSSFYNSQASFLAYSCLGQNCSPRCSHSPQVPKKMELNSWSSIKLRKPHMRTALEPITSSGSSGTRCSSCGNSAATTMYV